MRPETIRRTAVTRYDPREGVYIVESPLLEICRGVEYTEEEAREIFEDGVQAMYIKYLEGKQVARYKRGRPPKNAVNMHILVSPNCRTYIDDLKRELECSQGEAIEYLAHFHRCKAAPSARPTTRTRLLKPVKKVSHAQRA